VVPRAQTLAGLAADDVGDDVVDVEDAAVGQEALQKFGPDAEDARADDEGEVQRAPAVGVEDPVEDERQDEEGEEVQDLVVEVEMERAEARIAGEKEEDEEDSCGFRSR